MGSTQERIQVIFEVSIGSLQAQVKNAVKDIRNLGLEGARAGINASRGMDDLTDSTDEADESLTDFSYRVSTTGNTLDKTGNAAERFSNKLKVAFKGIAFGLIAKQVADMGVAMAGEYGKTQTALGEMASLGYENMEVLRQEAIDFSNTWSGTTREGFISAAYDIKSGIASLSDEGVAKLTTLAGVTAKATKSSIEEMTNLFATGYGIYRNMYSSDLDFGENFGAGIAKSVQQFKTKGSEMAAYLSTLGATAAQAGVKLEEVFAVGGTLQATMTGSEAATKYNSFLKNAVKASQALGMNFLDANNQLLPAVDIVETIRQKYGMILDANEKLELSQAFGDEEAVKFVDLLYNKIEEVRDAQGQVNQAMNEGQPFVEGMADALNSGIIEKLEIAKQNWLNLMEQMGKEMAPGIIPLLDAVANKLTQIGQSEDFDRLSQAIGVLIGALGSELLGVLDHSDTLISALANVMEFLANNIDFVVGAIKAGIAAWLAWKVAIAGVSTVITAGELVEKIALIATELPNLGTNINSIITTIRTFISGLGGLGGMFGALSGWISGAIASIGAFLASMGPVGWAILVVVGIITGLIAVMKIFGISWDELKDSVANGVDKALLAFKKFEIGILQSIKNILGNLPLIGDAIASACDRGIAGLQADRDALQSGIDERNRPKGSRSGLPERRDFRDFKDGIPDLPSPPPKPEDQAPEVSAAGNLPVKIKSGGSGGGGKKWTIQDDINAIEEKYDPELDLYDSRADLAEKQKDTTTEKTNREAMVDVLNRQVKELLNLEGKVTGDNKSIVETARNKLLMQIAEITEDIRGGINNMVGEFSKPSGLSAMTKYDYLVSTTETTSMLYGNTNNLEFILNVKDLGGLSMEQVKEKALEMISYMGTPLMGPEDLKNAIAQQAMFDIPRS